MKLQGLSIIFALIVIPVILVLTYYIQLQVDTITLQTKYDSNLLDATHGAMVAFELNTANEDLSSVADSLRTIIDASNNIFMNTLATNMGLSNASKSYLEPFIPAILYTLYDGYYINSPTKTPEIAVDGSGVALEINSKSDNPNKFSVPGLKYSGSEYIYNSDDTTYYDLSSVPAQDYGELLYKKNNGNYTTNINDENIAYSTNHMLKSYMPYSARYMKGTTDVTINYTLDNYMTIVVNADGKSYTKSGYLIKEDLVGTIKVNGTDLSHYPGWQNENKAEEIIKNALNNGQTVTANINMPNLVIANISTTDINSDEASAIIYYAKAKIFSNWVYTNLGNLQEKDIVENLSNEIIGTTEKGTEQIVYSFEGKDSYIFDRTQDPEKDNSTFVNHKYQVIRNSIQYNLNLAMSIYNERTTSSYDFNMPVIKEDEWEKIIENVSIVSFMQGVECGLKTYNNYAIVSSTNNELTVIPDEIYYVLEDEFNNESGVYHRLGCPRLTEKLASATNRNLTSFTSKEVKYDKIYNKNQNPPYTYDHKNLACYTCIVDGNYTEYYDIDKQKAYYIATAKERNNMYKMNSIKYSEGYEIIYDVESSIAKLRSGSFNVDVSKIKNFEITFAHIPAEDIQETTVTIKFDGILASTYVLNTNQSKVQTLAIPMDRNIGGTINANIIKNSIQIDSDTISVDVTDIKNAVKNIKVIYE